MKQLTGCFGRSISMPRLFPGEQSIILLSEIPPSHVFYIGEPGANSHASQDERGQQRRVHKMSETGDKNIDRRAPMIMFPNLTPRGPTSGSALHNSVSGRYLVRSQRMYLTKHASIRASVCLHRSQSWMRPVQSKYIYVCS
jgi:hypothetical protein